MRKAFVRVPGGLVKLVLDGFMMVCTVLFGLTQGY